MTFRDLKDLGKDDVLGALGLQTRQSTGSWMVGSLAVFGVGLCVGAAVALMLTPKTGRELRQELGTKIRRGIEQNGQTVEGGV